MLWLCISVHMKLRRPVGFVSPSFTCTLYAEMYAWKPGIFNVNVYKQLGKSVSCENYGVINIFKQEIGQ